MTLKAYRAGARPATTTPDAIVKLEPHQGRYNPGEPRKWRAWYEGAVIVERHVDPEFAACRILLERGITGRVQFVHLVKGIAGLDMDIQKGALLSAVESERGVYFRKYEPYPSRDRTQADESRPHDVGVAEEVI